jgi:hypothetical protein
LADADLGTLDGRRQAEQAIAKLEAILGPSHAEVVSRKQKLAAATPPPPSDDPPEVAQLRSEIPMLVALLGAGHALVRERQERLAELAPDAAMEGGESPPLSPSIQLQRKLRYLGILEQKLAKQDKKVEAAEKALLKAEEDLAAAQARGRELLAKQDQALKEREELAKLANLPTASVSPVAPAWLSRAKELASAAPQCEAATLLAQYHETAAKLEALAAAPPQPSLPIPATPLPANTAKEEGRVTTTREGRSRTPDRHDSKRLKDATGGGKGSAGSEGIVA